jgi:peptidoglycan/xylan/chitin deacetylase (PgdA/CDA1 family)
MKKSSEYSRRDFLRLMGLTVLGGAITSCSPKSIGLNLIKTENPYIQKTLARATPTTNSNSPTKISPTDTPAHTAVVEEIPTATGNSGKEPTLTAYPQIGKFTQDKINFLTHHEVREGDTSLPVVMMTYDDVGTFKQVEVILKAFKKYSPSKATFFFTGEKILPSARVVRAIIEDGHIIGCHGWSHRSFSKLSDEKINLEIERCFEAIDKVVPGYRFQFIRFPYGDSVGNPRVLHLAAQYGMQHVYWTMGSNGLIKNTKSIVTSKVKNGSIVLSHMFRYFDVNQADEIVSALIEKGFSLESVKTGRKPEDIYSDEKP